uniref:DNA repair protein n=1 Tax=Fervidicoccus fontis TaxID=683846 RepID=A0A7J3ZJU2_9CREN
MFILEQTEILPDGGLKLDPRLCVLCRGGRYLCGYAFCPIVVKSIARRRHVGVWRRRELHGSSPPTVFVGRAGYPVVAAGPAVPPVRGDTREYDLPEAWRNTPLEKILDYRLSLVLGRSFLRVDSVNSKAVRGLQELALSLKPVEVELVLEKPPRPVVLLDDHAPPMGPAAPLRHFRLVGNVSPERIVERVYSDTDLKSSEAVYALYESGIPVTHIQRLLSVGCLGVGRLRRLVPTRWSITAVDDMISRRLVERIKGYETIDKVQVFVRKSAKNLFVAILAPRTWSFEWMEAWFPKSTWNPSEDETVVEGDYEEYWGRSRYAAIGGCYYAARLATVEYLNRIRRQATAILLREIYPGFTIPIGVWFVRENLREMFSTKPVEFDELKDALRYVSGFTKLDISVWISSSRLIRRLAGQRKITSWMDA